MQSSNGISETDTSYRLLEFHHENGAIHRRIEMCGRKHHGMWEQYNESAILVRSVTMNQGIRHGLEQRFHETGQLFMQSNWEHGILRSRIEHTFYGQSRRSTLEYVNDIPVPNSVRLYVENQPETTCPICQEELMDPVVTPCGHIYCRNCIRQHQQHQPATTCPVCKTVLNMQF